MWAMPEKDLDAILCVLVQLGMPQDAWLNHKMKTCNEEFLFLVVMVYHTKGLFDLTQAGFKYSENEFLSSWRKWIGSSSMRARLLARQPCVGLASLQRDLTSSTSARVSPTIMISCILLGSCPLVVQWRFKVSFA